MDGLGWVAAAGYVIVSYEKVTIIWMRRPTAALEVLLVWMAVTGVTGYSVITTILPDINSGNSPNT